MSDDAPAHILNSMHHARADFIRWFHAWIATNPSSADIEMEMDGTRETLRQLVELHK